MTKAFLQILLVFLLITMKLFAQSDLRVQLVFAESLYNSESYWDAITEYKRLQFFDKEKQYSYITNYRIAECYKAGAKFDDAIRYFTKAEMDAPSDSAKYEMKIEIVRTNILRKSTDRALEILNELQNNKELPVNQNEIAYWRGWSYMFADKWDKAAEEFTKTDNSAELESYCKHVIHDKYSVTIAKVISYILPGSGQIYTGQYLSGAMSLGWNILCGYWTINAFSSDRIFDGFVIGDLLWLRFYRGNIQNAGKFAEEKNLEIANKQLSYIQKNYTGIKP